MPTLAQQTHHHIRQLPPGHPLIQHRHHFATGLLRTGLALFSLANSLFHTIGTAFLVIEELLELLQQRGEQAGIIFVIINDAVHRLINPLVEVVLDTLLRIPLATGPGQHVQQ